MEDGMDGSLWALHRQLDAQDTYLDGEGPPRTK